MTKAPAWPTNGERNKGHQSILTPDVASTTGLVTVQAVVRSSPIQRQSPPQRPGRPLLELQHPQNLFNSGPDVLMARSPQNSAEGSPAGLGPIESVQ